MRIESWHITGSSFHFGQHGLGQEKTLITFPSDSLFAALLARLAETENRQTVEDFMSPFLDGKPPFVLCSTFPFAGGVRFFPVPACALRSTDREEDDKVKAKDLKKVLFISEGIFRSLLKGDSLAKHYQISLMLQGKRVLVSPPEIVSLPEELRQPEGQIWALEQRPRVTLGRAVQNSAIYFTGQVVYSRGCGLWFGVRWLKEDTKLKNKLAVLLADLGDAGLGGERSVGFGACQIKTGDILELPEAQDKPWVTLSRYLPRSDEIAALLQSEKTAYTLDVVGGWLDSPVKGGQRRRSLNLLGEGSVFGSLDHPVPGRIVDVRPCYPTNHDPLGHAVYRSGLALAVGLEGSEA